MIDMSDIIAQAVSTEYYHELGVSVNILIDTLKDAHNAIDNTDQVDDTYIVLDALLRYADSAAFKHHSKPFTPLTFDKAEDEVLKHFNNQGVLTE